MSKTDKRRKRNIRKKQKQLVGCELAATPVRKARGRARMREIKAEALADIPAIMVRARETGSKDLPAMRSQGLEGPPGQALRLFAEVHHPKDPSAAHARLYEAFMGYCNAKDKADRVLRGTSIHAKCANIETEPERFETRSDHTPSDWTEEEKIAHVKKMEKLWTDRLNSLPLGPRSFIQSAHMGWVALIENAKLTRKGVDFCMACQLLADTVDT